jgi:hypothetical protein
MSQRTESSLSQWSGKVWNAVTMTWKSNFWMLLAVHLALTYALVPTWSETISFTVILIYSKRSVIWNSIFWDITSCSPLKSTSVSEDHVVTIFGIKEDKQETRIKQVASSGLFFNPEDGGYMYLQNANWLSMDYVALYPRRHNSS